MKFKIYTKTGCSFCERAKEWFSETGIDFDTVSLDNELVRAEFYEQYDVKSVPQIFIDGKLFGDYHKLTESPEDVLMADGRGSLTSFSKFFKPFLFPWAVELTQKHEDIHWTEKEADLQEDVNDWKGGKLTDIDKDFISNILRFFTSSDVAVGQNYCDQFIPKFKNNEIRNMLVSFCAREGIHQRAYALLNDTLGLPDSEFHAFLDYKEMSDKFDYMMEYDNNSQKGLALCLAKSVFNEGVSLFASFVMLLNFQRFGKMKGMGKVVEWSILDEALVSGTKVVTKEGLKVIEDITLEDLVLQFDMGTKDFSYINPNKHQGVIRDESYKFSHPEFNQHVSPNHRMIYEQNGKIKECLAKDFIPAPDKFFIVKD